MKFVELEVYEPDEDKVRIHSKTLNINIEMIETWEKSKFEGLILFRLASGRIFEVTEKLFESALRTALRKEENV